MHLLIQCVELRATMLVPVTMTINTDLLYADYNTNKCCSSDTLVPVKLAMRFIRTLILQNQDLMHWKMNNYH